jgi:hypothetical protein
VTDTLTTAVEALKPCPFCGCKAEILHLNEGENAGGSCVSCTCCLASSNVEFGRKENFVFNWNRRALAAIDAAQPDVGGVIVADSSLKRYRTWQGGCPSWTDNRAEATRYHRRADAEAVHTEDENAWHIVTYATGEDAPDDTQTAAETRGWNAAIEAAAQLVDLAKERTLGLAIRTLARPEGGA